MRYIKKQAEPEAFSNWKGQGNEEWQPSWQDLRDDSENSDRQPKSALHKSLLVEQGYICCYCGRRINKSSSHIEHLKPRQLYPQLGLEYSNLLASCPGYSEEEDSKALTVLQPCQEHCGHKKGNWYSEKLMISPLTESCADSFAYTAFGEVLSSKIEETKFAAEETISRLGLNSSRLEASRRLAIEGLLFEIRDLSVEEIQELIQWYDKPDADGKYVRFCSVLLYFLQQMI